MYKKYESGRKSVETMTGLKVLEVNVHVQGVKTENDREVIATEEPEQELNNEQ